MLNDTRLQSEELSEGFIKSSDELPRKQKKSFEVAVLTTY
jgi:hypothetical protein